MDLVEIEKACQPLAGAGKDGEATAHCG